MKSFIEKIFYVHDTQVNKKSKYSNILGMMIGIFMIVSSPVILIYGNNLAEQIIEKRINSHMYFIKTIDKNLNVVSNTDKENCMIDEFIRTTDIDNKLTKKIPYFFAIFSLFIGYNLIQISLLSLKLKKKIVTDKEHNKFEETNNLP